MVNMNKRLYAYMTYLIIVTLVVTAVSMSRYATMVTGSEEVGVAKVVIQYEPISAIFNWYSDVSHPNYSSWNNFYKNNNWTQGDVLIWHFGNTDQTRTFVWDHSSKKKDQPPHGKWVEIG